MRSEDSPRTELDSHADTCCFGSESAVVHKTQHHIEVRPFLDEFGAIDKVPIVTAAIAYDDPKTGHTFVLFFPQALYFESLRHNLLCPMQLRDNGVAVHETPLLYTSKERRSHLTHSISHEEYGLHVPLKLDGVVSYFVSRRPSDNELNDPDLCTHVLMTREQPWDPSDTTLARSEEAIRQKLTSERALSPMIAAFRSFQCSESRRQRTEQPTVSALRAKGRKTNITPEGLAALWRIGEETAKRTLEATTQLAVRDLGSASGDRRLKPTAYQLRFRRLRVEMYCDILIGKTKSLRGNSCAVVFATPFHWVRIYPIMRRRDAHTALKSLFKDHGVPHTLIPDNANELTKGDFKRTADKAQCAIRPVEAYTPNQNVAETAIREIKRAYRRHMISTHTPVSYTHLTLPTIA